MTNFALVLYCIVAAIYVCLGWWLGLLYFLLCALVSVGISKFRR